MGRNFSKKQLLAFGVIDENGNPILDADKQLKTIEPRAATQIWCATNPKLNNIGGVYYENVEVAEAVDITKGVDWKSDDNTRLLGVMPYAINPLNTDKL